MMIFHLGKYYPSELGGIESGCFFNIEVRMIACIQMTRISVP